ncbi:MAG: cysteine hydrolase family protein, partial [Gaiellales bacterium]
MIEIDGREILTTLEDKVDPARAAVIVIDMQKDFTTPGCFWDQLGQLDAPFMGGLADRLARFLDAAREHGVQIVHVMANYDPQYMSGPMHERLFRHGIGRYCQSGTQGIEFHEGLEPAPGEPVVVKHRFDAFYDTELDVLLQSRGIQTVITTGVAVHGCVDSTSRHAYFKGYYVVFGADLAGGATPEVHQMTLDSI